MKKLVISVGPIPARLDSVKFITNKFKGGLALKTLYMLIEKESIIIPTIIKWKNTELDNIGDKKFNIVNINDVDEYYNWFKENAINYDIFILAGAVANLTPTKPFEGKFPSHLYKEGDKFNIEFTIAPRSIDIIKKINPTACLIGYKLFDCETDAELIEVGRTVLHESKANIIFANTPKDAKNRKLALMQDNSVIDCTFEQHVDLILKLIDSRFYKTEIIDEYAKTEENYELYQLVNLFEQSIDKFGTIAFKTKEGGIITTCRGHQKGLASYIYSIDNNKLIIKATQKATLNAPLLLNFLKNTDYDYVVHRHNFLPNMHSYSYQFPGTTEETLYGASTLPFNIESHGYIKGYNIQDVDWNKYFEIFPQKYFSFPGKIQEYIDNSHGKETLEVGGNTKCECKYSLDVNVNSLTAINLTYSDIEEKSMKFDLIVLRNSISYLSVQQLKILQKALNKGGILIGNTYRNAPHTKMTLNELSIEKDGLITHYLIKDDVIYKHYFYHRNEEFYTELGFTLTFTSEKSMLVEYKG